MREIACRAGRIAVLLAVVTTPIALVCAILLAINLGLDIGAELTDVRLLAMALWVPIGVALSCRLLHRTVPPPPASDDEPEQPTYAAKSIS